MANEKRLIDANALKTKVFNLTLYVQGLRFGKTVINNILESYRRGVFEEIDNAPTVDAVEVVHGRWIEDYETFVQDNGYESEPIHTGFVCSVCGRHSCSIEPYCHCGAKMDGGNTDG